MIRARDVNLAAFSSDYVTARSRFRASASQLGWQLEAHPIDAAGPGGEELTIDVASSTGDPTRVLVISSGTHGVEGFFGSAVQLALLDQWGRADAPPISCVFVHALNPYGFAWRRRVNENNVDLNRNFLLPGERFEGVNEHYGRLDPFLNPRRPPTRGDLFTLKALPFILRHGIPAIRQAIAEGQYSYPRGLFYGGAGPSRTQQLLSAHMPRWLAGSTAVVHLDFHTGLGRSGACKLLIDYALTERQRGRLIEWFGAGSFESADPAGIAYKARGAFGRWCVSRHLAPDYLFAYPEFGTYGSIRMVAGLRAENQAHHWGEPSARATLRAKEHLQELFCPADRAWRSGVLEKSLELVDRALQCLQRCGPSS